MTISMNRLMDSKLFIKNIASQYGRELIRAKAPFHTEVMGFPFECQRNYNYIKHEVFGNIIGCKVKLNLICARWLSMGVPQCHWNHLLKLHEVVSASFPLVLLEFLYFKNPEKVKSDISIYNLMVKDICNEWNKNGSFMVTSIKKQKQLLQEIATQVCSETEDINQFLRIKDSYWKSDQEMFKGFVIAQCSFNKIIKPFTLHYYRRLNEHCILGPAICEIAADHSIFTTNDVKEKLSCSEHGYVGKELKLMFDYGLLDRHHKSDKKRHPYSYSLTQQGKVLTWILWREERLNVSQGLGLSF